jgi:hypothetical protein
MSVCICCGGLLKIKGAARCTVMDFVRLNLNTRKRWVL